MESKVGVRGKSNTVQRSAAEAGAKISVGFPPYPRLGIHLCLLSSLSSNPDDLRLLLYLRLIPRPYHFHIISPSLRPCLSCLPCLLRLFLNLSLKLGPCLSLRPLSLCSMDLGSKPDLGGSLHCRPIYNVVILPCPCLELGLLPSLDSKPGNLFPLPCFDLGPCPCPLHSTSLRFRICLPCLPCLLQLFLDFSLIIGPCLSL